MGFLDKKSLLTEILVLTHGSIFSNIYYLKVHFTLNESERESKKPSESDIAFAFAFTQSNAP